MRVIVTRPLREAHAWVDAIKAAGHEAVAWPLIDIRAARDQQPVQQAWQSLGSYDAVMFVSANAVDHFFAVIPDAAAQFQRHTPVRAWATGPGTTAALRRVGVDADRIDAPGPESAQLDTEALWSRVGAGVQQGHSILIVRGSDGDESHAAQGVGRDWLAQQLTQAQASVTFVVSYERGLPHWDASQCQLAIQAAQDGSLWLFSSSQALANLQTLVPKHTWHKARALATHPRIAQAVAQAGFGEVREVRPLLPDVLASIESSP